VLGHSLRGRGGEFEFRPLPSKLFMPPIIMSWSMRQCS
jgi:hypothetical protein